MDNQVKKLRVSEKNEMFFSFIQAKKSLILSIMKFDKNIKSFHLANIKTVFDLRNFILKYQFRNKKNKIMILEDQIFKLYNDLDNPGIKDLINITIHSDLIDKKIQLKEHILLKVFHKLIKKDIDNYFLKLQTEERFKNEFNSFYKKYSEIIEEAIFNRKEYLTKDNEERTKETRFIEAFINELWFYIDEKVFNLYSNKIFLSIKNKDLFSFPLYLFYNVIIPANGIQKNGSNFILITFSSSYNKNKQKTLKKLKLVKEQIDEAREENNRELEKQLVAVYKDISDKLDKSLIDHYLFPRSESSSLSELEFSMNSLVKFLDLS